MYSRTRMSNSTVSKLFGEFICEHGGIGIHAVLRGQWRKPWEFKSPCSHYFGLALFGLAYKKQYFRKMIKYKKLNDFVVTMPIYIPRQKVNHIFCNIFGVICSPFYKTRNKNKTKNILHRILIVLI